MRDIDPMKLQKLVYISHGWNLAILVDPLISQAVKAWKYGPVIPDLYHEFKEFGADPIARKARRVDPETGSLVDFPAEIASETVQVVDRVWDSYKDYTGVQLSTLTHQPGTPWHQVMEFRKRHPNASLWIPNKLIRDHYLKLAGKA